MDFVGWFDSFCFHFPVRGLLQWLISSFLKLLGTYTLL